MLDDPASISIAGLCAFAGVILSLCQILAHLRNYTEPLFQRYIIRLIFMVPVYAVGSWFSLKYRASAIYFDTVRDCYEAWIIYNFTSLLLAYVGGPGAVVVKAEGKIVHPSWPHLTCCLPAMQVDGFFLRRCKQGTLQFVLMKPVMAALTLILYSAGAYTDGDMSPKNGYFYISILYNVCYTLALYGLLLFWIGAAELLEPFNPLLKFILVKTVVFLTFWQGIAISMINSMGKIRDPEDGKALQNFLICIEMLIAGTAMMYAFPHKQYCLGGSTSGFRLDAFAHAVSISDVVKDTIHVFAPSYSDYVLYSDGGPAEHVKRKKYRGQKGGLEPPKPNVVKRIAKQGLAGLDDVLEAGGRLAKGKSKRKMRTTASKTERDMERNRNTAVLVDSDSDAMGSDEEGGGRLGTTVASDSESEGGIMGGASSPDTDGAAMTPPAGRRMTGLGSERVVDGANEGGATPPGSGRRVATAVAATAPATRSRRRIKLLSSSSSDSEGGAGSERAAAAAAVDSSEDEDERATGGSTVGPKKRQQLPEASSQLPEQDTMKAPAVQTPPRRNGSKQQRVAQPGGAQKVQPREAAQLPKSQLPQKQKQDSEQQAAGSGQVQGGGGSAGDDGMKINLPAPRSATQRLAAAKAAAKSAAAANAAEMQQAGWAAEGWGDEGQKAVGSGEWAEAGWSNPSA